VNIVHTEAGPLGIGRHVCIEGFVQTKPHLRFQGKPVVKGGISRLGRQDSGQQHKGMNYKKLTHFYLRIRKTEKKIALTNFNVKRFYRALRFF
jgi:hypothetical protein